MTPVEPPRAEVSPVWESPEEKDVALVWENVSLKD